MKPRRFSNLILFILAATLFSACSAVARHHQLLNHQDANQNSAAQPDPISGEWNVSFFVHDKPSPATFSLKLEGDKVTGTAYSEHTGPGTVRDGKWTNNKLSFTLDFAKHESIVITGGARDGKLAGEFQTEGFVSTWEATRK